MKDVTPEEHDDTSSADDSSDSEPAVESLIAGRERRRTAGNRYDREAVIEEVVEPEDEDEVNLLFAEQEDEEEDEEFMGDEGDDDADMSSSDDDDQGPNVATADLEGEKELQHGEKAERANKRKRDLALTTHAGLRKKPKLDPMLPTKSAVATKPSKKKERVSWLPAQEAASGRTSLRAQTIAHREVTIANLKASEIRSARAKALKEQRDKERGDEAPKEMTQADRLAEAERVERKNAKSLNRWEAQERKRAEEQAARLAALKDRTLEGPVVTWLSAKGTWLGTTLNKIGERGVSEDATTELKKRGRKPKSLLEQGATASEGQEDKPASDTIKDKSVTPAPSESIPAVAEKVVETSFMSQVTQPQITFTQPQGPDDFLQGIHEYASMRSNPASVASAPGDAPSITSVPPVSTAAHLDNAAAVPSVTAPDSLHIAPIIPQPPLVEEIATRNLVTLKDFEDLSGQERADYGFFFNKKSAKPVKSFKQAQELCPITTLPARFRDPSTGITYANMFAYKKLQEVKQHKFTWSSMLGCYVGRAGIVARGVPEGFLGP